jgi:hypothetical protein
LLVVGCGGAEAVSSISDEVIYGSDDRSEYFEAGATAQDRLTKSVVALVPWSKLSPSGELDPAVPSLGTVRELCPEERFAEQPVAAFCSGVLVDWDTVLTAGHCVHQLALQDFAVTFDYHYAEPGRLALDAGDSYTVSAIIAEALVRPGDEVLLDYALLRLDEPVRAPRRPARIVLDPALFEIGDQLMVAGSSSGTPVKVDEAARLQALREQADYFVARTDTARGSSGGGAFSREGALLGVLARGAVDLTETTEGCNETVHIPDGEMAEEEFTYAFRAIEAWCADDPDVSSLCRDDCGAICEGADLDPTGMGAVGGCSFAESRPLEQWPISLFLPVLASARRIRRRRVPPHRR